MERYPPSNSRRNQGPPDPAAPPAEGHLGRDLLSFRPVVERAGLRGKAAPGRGRSTKGQQDNRTKGRAPLAEGIRGRTSGESRPRSRPADPTISRAVGSANTGTRRRWRWSRTRCTCRRRARGGGGGSGRTGSRGRRTSCRTIRSASRRRCARGGGRVRTGSRVRRTCYCSVCIECSFVVFPVRFRRRGAQRSAGGKHSRSAIFISRAKRSRKLCGRCGGKHPRATTAPQLIDKVNDSGEIDEPLQTEWGWRSTCRMALPKIERKTVRSVLQVAFLVFHVFFE